MIVIMMAYRLLQLVGILSYMVVFPPAHLWVANLFGFILFGA